LLLYYLGLLTWRHLDLLWETARPELHRWLVEQQLPTVACGLPAIEVERAGPEKCLLLLCGLPYDGLLRASAAPDGVFQHKVLLQHLGARSMHKAENLIDQLNCHDARLISAARDSPTVLPTSKYSGHICA